MAQTEAVKTLRGLSTKVPRAGKAPRKVSQCKASGALKGPKRAEAVCGIEKFMAWDGSRTKKKVGKGHFVAMCSAQNGTESMFPVDIDTLQSRGWKAVKFSVTAETQNAKRKPMPLPPKPRIHRGNWRRAGVVIREKVIDWCLENPGFSLTKVGPGKRGSSAEAKEHFKEGKVSVIGARKGGNCLMFAVLNAVARVIDVTTAKKLQGVMQRQGGGYSSGWEASRGHCIPWQPRRDVRFRRGGTNLHMVRTGIRR
ncbi:hypothetical protein FGB62_229g09 [Gracilaria domingensis]|nr:hypothetical protein FGB62_229g09 [Gracilaria domingensis]